METVCSFQETNNKIDQEIQKKVQKESEKDSFSIINLKIAKIEQMKRMKKPKQNLYSILAVKLEQQLKGIKNHYSNEARQKLALLQKCKNQKHTRTKSRQMTEQSKQRIYNSTKTSFYRPLTACTACSTNTKFRQNNVRRYRKQNNKENKYFLSAIGNELENKVSQITQSCVRQTSTSKKLKKDIQTVHFYQTLVNKNLSKIFKKIL